MKYVTRDEAWESILQRLNDAVHQEFHQDSLARSSHVTLQVTGLPRSGTTLLMQALAASKAIGYSSNIMALFWKTPWIGAMIQAKMTTTAPISFESLVGRTPQPLDPHEFGYFWRHFLGHGTNSLIPDRAPVPANELRRQLDLVNSAFSAPTAFKNFLVPSHLHHFDNVGNQRYVLTTRPLEQVAASLMAARRSTGTPDNAWLGPEPPNSPTTFSDPIERVAYQAVRLAVEIERSGLHTKPETIVVTYDELCKRPKPVVERILRHAGVATSPTLSLPNFAPRDALAPLGHSERALLLRHIARFREEYDYEE